MRKFKVRKKIENCSKMKVVEVLTLKETQMRV